MLRIFLAVLSGYILIGILVAATDQLFGFAIPGFSAMKMPPVYYFGISLLSDFVYSTVGGYVCALIARSQSRPATLALIVMGEVIGIFTQLALWNTVPHWFGLSLLILFPVGVYLGSRLRTSRARLA